MKCNLLYTVCRSLEKTWNFTHTKLSYETLTSNRSNHIRLFHFFANRLQQLPEVFKSVHLHLGSLSITHHEIWTWYMHIKVIELSCYGIRYIMVQEPCIRKVGPKLSGLEVRYWISFLCVKHISALKNWKKHSAWITL